MSSLDDNDLKPMNESYFETLDQKKLVEVAKNLHSLAVALWEKQRPKFEQ